MYLVRREYLSSMTSPVFGPRALTVTVVVTVTGITMMPVESPRMI